MLHFITAVIAFNTDFAMNMQNLSLILFTYNSYVDQQTDYLTRSHYKITMTAQW